MLSGEGRAQPVGDRARLDGDRLAGLEPAVQRVGELGLDGDDAAPLGGDRDPGDEPAAADRDDDDRASRDVLERSRGRRCPGRRSSTGRRRDARAGGPSPPSARAGGRTPRPGPSASRSTSAPYARVASIFCVARALPHDEQRVDPLERGAVGERLRVVARGDADHAAPLLLGRERGELRQDAARLERAGALEELGLQVDRCADPLAERGRGEDRRAMQPARRSPRARRGRRRVRELSAMERLGGSPGRRPEPLPASARARPDGGGCGRSGTSSTASVETID